METDKNTVNSYIREIEGFLDKKRVLYEAEGKRDFVPLIDRTVQMLRTIKDTVSETSSAEQSKSSSSSSQHTFDRLPGKMYHYAEGEVIDCAICIEQVEAKQAQVSSHFNHSGDFKCPYCRLEVEDYSKQPRAWEYPVNGPPTQQNLNETNDIPHPGELDFANFQRGVLQVVNSIFGGRLNLGHPFRDDNGTEEEFFDNEAEDGSDVDQAVYEPHFDEVPDSLENSENEYDSEHNLSDDSEDEPYELVDNYRYVTLVRRDGTSEIEPPQLSIPRSSSHNYNNYYHGRERYYGYPPNSSHSPVREIYGGSGDGASSHRYEIRSNNIPSFIERPTQVFYERSQSSRSHSISSTPFVRTEESSYNNNSNRHSYNNTTQPILNETPVNPIMRYEATSDSEYDEFSNEIFRRSTSSSRLRNLYQGENSSREGGINDVEDIETSSSSSSSPEHSENGMDTSDEDEGFRRCFSRPYSASSDSQAHHNTPGTKRFSTTSDLTVNGVDSDTTISSGDEFELYS
ncbi:1376_t:CDS:10 [Diversispora eburnea]|uniref:1376_t:CDS:1 n=1 Tax=Diversispora eburnea TaxID=1213867 RepID=A0A9N8UWQ3_9GLOM|nr:1376_t:CDS:10 [Diversispora eburnea]